MTTLKAVTTKIGSGATPRGGASVYVDEGAAFIRSQNVLDLCFSNEGLVRIGEDAAEGLRNVAVEPGDVLVNITGDSVARVALWTRSEPARVSQHVAIVRCDPAQADARYMQYWLHAPGQKAQLLTLAAAGASRPALTKGMLEAFPFGPHPLAEQKAIAEVLGALDDKIAANRHAVQAGRELLLAQWSRLVSDAEETRKWSTFVETNPKVPNVKDETAPYLDMKNLPENGLLVEEWGERPPQGGARFQNGDTLFARITPCFENGKHAYVDFLGDGEVGYGSTEYIVFRACEGASAAIPFVISATADFRSFAAQHRTGTSGRQRVQAPDLASYEAAWPGDLRAAEFGAFAEPLIARLGAARDENRVLAKTRDELLPLLMSGKITVRDAEKRVEGVV